MDIPFIDDLVGGVVTDAADAVLDAVTGFVFGLVIGAIEAITNGLIYVMNANSEVSLTGPEFAGLSEIRAQILGMSLFLVLGFLFVNVMRSVSRGEPGAVIRAILVDLPSALLYTALFTAFVNVLIVVVDDAADAMVGDLGESVGQIGAVLVAGNTVASTTGGAAAPVGGLLALIFGLLYIFAAMIVWAELMIRAALIYIVIVAAPLGFAARASAGARQIARRTIEVMVGLILSKLGIALAFGVGASLIDTGNSFGESDGGVIPVEDVSAMFVGVTVVLLAAFMPWMILKMIPIMESATDMAGAERSPMKAAAGGAGLAIAAVGAAKFAGSGTGSGGGVGGSQLGPSGGIAPTPSGPGSSGGGSGRGAPSGSGGHGGLGGPHGSWSAASRRSGPSSSAAGDSATGGSETLAGGAGGDDGGVKVLQVSAPRPGVVAVSAPSSNRSESGLRGAVPLGSTTRDGESR